MNRAFNDRNNIVIYEAECILTNLIVNIIIMHIVWKKCLSNYYFLIFGIFIILLISVPESAGHLVKVHISQTMIMDATMQAYMNS